MKRKFLVDEPGSFHSCGLSGLSLGALWSNPGLPGTERTLPKTYYESVDLQKISKKSHEACVNYHELRMCRGWALQPKCVEPRDCNSQPAVCDLNQDSCAEIFEVWFGRDKNLRSNTHKRNGQGVALANTWYWLHPAVPLPLSLVLDLRLQS